MDAGGHRTELGVRAGCKCLHFWFLLTILFLQWTQSEKNVFCENWEELTSCVCKAPMSGTVEKIVHNKITKITFGMTGAHPVANKIHQEVLPLFYVAVFSNQKMLPGFTVHLMLCKADSGPLDCDEGIWIYVLFPCTCTLSPKNNPNRNETLDYGAIWMILFRNSPHRCTPLLCLDANAHVGLVRGPGGEWGSLQSTAVGSFFPEPQNFNGGLFLSILEKHFLVAANTFFEVGPTFYGPPPRRHATRVDYICVPASCLQTVARCHVQYKAADRLQIICDSARRDHVPLQMEITLRLEYVGSAQKVEQQWDQETLTRDALSGRRRHILLNAVETKLAEKFGEVGAAQVDSPDRLWKHFATAIREAVSETYPPQTRQTKSRPRDTQDAVEAMLCSRALLVSYRPLVLGKGRFHLDGVHTPCLHQALHDLLHVWRLSANYPRARKRMDICTKRDAKEKHDNILQDFQRAWQQRDLHQVWRLSRALSGKRIGPKRRRYDAAKTVNPSQQEWMAFLQNEGPAGGCNANEVHWDDIVGNAENHTAVYLDYWTARRRAQQDLLGLRKSAQYASLRKMCPPWGIPTEVWRQLLLPQWKVDSVRCGVGFRASPPSPTLFNRILLHLLTSIRMFNRMPHEWQRSHTTGLDKHNGKEGPAGLRLINNLEVLGKWYCASLWRRGCAHSQRDYASGYIRGKSRIAAMLQQCALQSRLRGHRVSHCLSLLDVSNAFPSPTRASLRMAVSNVARPHDAALLQQRHDQTYMCIPARDADLCVQPGSGALQGDTVACSLFLEVYHPPLDKWLRETQQPELLVVDPVSGRLVDISVSSYADDVARCSVSESSEELYLHLSYSNEVLDKELLEIGLQQNTEKQEHVVFFAGSGSQSFLVDVYKDGLLPGRACVNAKYLGGWRHFKGSNDFEIRARRRAAEVGFYSMGKFWSRNSGRAALVVFSAMVRNAALSGLECLVLTDPEYRQLDATICKFSRKVLRGDACRKTQSATGKVFHAISDTDVYKLMRLVPSHLELCIRQLQYWQSVAREPHLHKLVLAAVFGKMVFDTHDTVLADGSLHGQANLWAKQLESDVLQLLTLDSAAERLVGLNGRILLLFSEFRNDFVCIDCGELRSKFFSVCIPPPGFTDECPVGSERDEHDCHEHLLQYSCTCHNADGTACTATFATYQALAMHIRRTSGGTHGKIHDHVRAAVCNQCPWCRNIFASIRVTQNHISRRLQYGRCGGSGSAFTAKVATPRHLQCPFCDSELNSLDQLYNCIVSHF